MRKSKQEISGSRVGGQVTQATHADEVEQNVRDVDVAGNIIQQAGQQPSFQGGESKKPRLEEIHQPLAALPALASPRPTLARRAAEAFLSYAPADAPLARAFEAHLAALKRDRLLATWHEGLVSPGLAWDEATCRRLDTAHLILLLISADFLTSDRCYNVHLVRALRRHEAGLARVIPILLRTCDWRTATLAAFEPLPKNHTPVTAWSDQDSAFAEIAASLRQALEALDRHSAHE